jgi:hypothetical protein
MPPPLRTWVVFKTWDLTSRDQFYAKILRPLSDIPSGEHQRPHDLILPQTLFFSQTTDKMVCATPFEPEITILTSSGARSILWRQEAKEEVVKGKGYADTTTTLSSPSVEKSDKLTNLVCTSQGQGQPRRRSRQGHLRQTQQRCAIVPTRHGGGAGGQTEDQRITRTCGAEGSGGERRDQEGCRTQQGQHLHESGYWWGLEGEYVAMMVVVRTLATC